MPGPEAFPSLRSLVTADPGLPRPDPTKPYWIHVPHRLADAQSLELPKTADVVIIGSGITGSSIALHTLQNSANCQVTVLEARSLCSGATGRNGGQVITYGAIMYSAIKKMVGKDQAHKILSFTFKNVEEVAQAVKRFGDEDSEYRPVTRIRCFDNDADLEEAKANVSEYEQDFPSESGKYEFISAETASEEHGIHGVVGAVLFSAGAIWPYRFIMKLWQVMLETSPERLSVEANTPATHVSMRTDAQGNRVYKVHTPRGTIEAANVVYATNGYTGHLLPAIRGLVFPFRSSMTVQDLSHEVPNRGNKNTWSINSSPKYHPDSGRTETGSLYLQQNGFSGQFFFGGEKPTPSEAVTADDSTISPESTRFLQKKLATFFGQQHAERNKLISEWTGIQGYTADETPLVGRLPRSLTGREGAGEWIAAGFNGGGMAYCWLVGKALAAMIRGEDVSDWFPEAFYPSEGRLASGLSVKASIAGMKELFPTARL
ncbi:hypothetical protein ACJ41O_015040 [Fusarium nematophilum]